MEQDSIKKLYKLLDKITVTSANRAQLNHIRELLDMEKFEDAMNELRNLRIRFGRRG